MILRSVSCADWPVLAQLHAACFPVGWSPQEIGDLASGPGGFGLLVEATDDGPAVPAGFILCRALVGEAEILTLAVDPRRRRRGLAQALLQAALGLAATAGAEVMFLDVAADNAAAIALYEGAGFERAGLRRGYYVHAGRPPVDGWVYRRTLNSAPSSSYA